MRNDYDNKFLIEGDEQWINEHIGDDGVSVSGDDTYKPNTNFILNDNRLKIISELKRANQRFKGTSQGSSITKRFCRETLDNEYGV